MEGALQLDSETGSRHVTSHPAAAEARAKLKYMYNNDDENSPIINQELFDILLKWKGDLDKQLVGRKFLDCKQIEEVVCAQLLKARLQGQVLAPPTFTATAEETNRLKDIMNRIGGEVSKKDPANILMVAQAGSYLYNLQTPESDADYVIIYADPAEEVIGACHKRSESFEKRGPHLSFEYGAYESRLLAEMLWKGSVVILELAFSDDLEYMSPLWKELVSDKSKFLTERAILQYFGLIKNNMVMIKNCKHKGTGRENKLFYQIFHKLHCLESFLRGEIPSVRCDGDVKEFIMKIRTGDLSGDLSRENLYTKAAEQVDSLKHRLAKRSERFPENVNHKFLTDWIMKVRGWTT